MEQILVVPTELVRPYVGEKGLFTGREQELYTLVEEKHSFMPRPEAEQDPGHKQIIPYIILTRGDEVFATRRTNRGGEQRLHGLIALGLGGHINIDDDDRPGIFQRGLLRELSEEAEFDAVGELTPQGVINDDTTEVGKVHLGFLFTLEVSRAAVRETEKLEGLWIRRSELSSHADRMEGWSQIALEIL
ncbi:MAG: hypothetical protein IJE26_06855 [Oscillospiraceae bacterium]|nr:hypothetical protein [Oscillospiraceae bacterium]